VFVQFLSDPSSPLFGQLLSSSIDASGFEMARAPEFSGNASITYRTPLAGGELALNGNLSYQSKFYFDAAHQYEQDGYSLLNLRATWTDPSDSWSFSVFGNNVTDEVYRKAAFGNPFAVQEAYGDPVTYGAEIAFRF
jgi:iron complex outermembrane receptor protein